MSKAQAMLAYHPLERGLEEYVRAQALRPPPNTPRPKPPPPRGGPLLRWVRQGSRGATWRPWWLLGLVEVVTYPWPRYRTAGAFYVPGMPASCGLPGRPGMLVAL